MKKKRRQSIKIASIPRPQDANRDQLLVAWYTKEEMDVLKKAHEMSKTARTIGRWVVDMSLDEARWAIRAGDMEAEMEGKVMDMETITALVKMLSFREREVILSILVDKLSVRDISKKFKVTRERIRQILEKVSRKMLKMTQEQDKFLELVRMTRQATMFQF